ncbi:MAG: Holliday junction branch migration protein RuvA [Clostridia bacterium]|nr:Holliday junction branch migration protein RuvA [Clostridia bacterium]
MFYYVKGTLVMTDPQSAVVDCGGVGYKLTISGNTLSHLTENGKTVCLYTYMSIREDAVELFGFYTLEELSAFKMLITVSGVGPKAAMSILSLLSPEKFAVAVSSGDSKALSKANGIGKKIADRIILELKDKVAKNISVDGGGGDDVVTVAGTVAEDALDALMVLGYPRGVALKALDGCAGDTLEDVLRAALKKLGSKM